jgi:hypothetical protein
MEPWSLVHTDKCQRFARSYCLHFRVQYWDSRFLRNVGTYLRVLNKMVSQPKDSNLKFYLLLYVIIILPRVLVTETGFGLVIGFIKRLQVATTVTYNTVRALHNLQSLHYNLLSLFPLVFTIRFLATDLNTGITTASHFKYHCTKSLLITINTAMPLFLHFMVTVTHNSPLLVTQLNTGTSAKSLQILHTWSLPLTLEVFNSHDQLFSNYEPSTVVSHLELTRNRASVCPINPWSDAGNASIVVSLLKRVTSLLTWSRDPPLLRHPSVYSCCLATNEVRRCEAIRHGSARLGSARLGTEKTPLRLLLHIRGSVFRCYCSCMAYIRYNTFSSKYEYWPHYTKPAIRYYIVM